MSPSDKRPCPIVTIGICVRNSEKTVGSCIKTLVSQTYPSRYTELIFVDGDSTDKTLSIVNDALLHTEVRSKVYSDQGRGLGYARQIVSLHAKGGYVVFVDGDVELLNDFVQRQVEFMEDNRTAGVAMGRYMCKKGSLISTLWSLRHDVDFENFVGNDATIYRGQVLREVGGFDEDIRGGGEDLDIIERIRSKGWLVSVNSKAGFYHKCKDSLGGLFVEQSWFGYGTHYLSHKHKASHSFEQYARATLDSFFYGSRVASKAYKSTYWSSSFLILPLIVLARVCWWAGFLRAHLDGYGHGIFQSHGCHS